MKTQKVLFTLFVLAQIVLYTFMGMMFLILNHRYDSFGTPEYALLGMLIFGLTIAVGVWFDKFRSKYLIYALLAFTLCVFEVALFPWSDVFKAIHESTYEPTVVLNVTLYVAIAAFPPLILLIWTNSLQKLEKVSASKAAAK